MIEHRAMGAVQAAGRRLRGLAIPYGVETRINGGTESIRAGAVTASLAARDVLALVERGDAGGMSFGFTTPAGGDEWCGSHSTLRTITLHEVSVITSHPAYASTTVEARRGAPVLELLRLRLETYR